MTTFTTHKKNLIARCEQRGYDIDEVMACVVEKKTDDMWIINIDHPAYPKFPKHNKDHPSYRIMENIRSGKVKNTQNFGEGVGTELKNLLSWMNIRATENCDCNSKAKFLNEKGIEWCKQNIDTICVWLKEEATKRNIPFFNYGATKLVKFAIFRAERKSK